MNARTPHRPPRRAAPALALLLAIHPAAAAAQWSGEVTVERFHWLEHTSPIRVRETGPRFAVGGAFVQPGEAGPLLGYRGRVYFGSVTYDGSYLFDPSRPARGATHYLGTAQAGEMRFRWPGLDGITGVEYEIWRRRFSEFQEESYRLLSARLGVERIVTPARRLGAGAGVRVMLAARETATSTAANGDVSRVGLSPGLSSTPFASVGYRVAPRLTLVAYYDGARLGQSNQVPVGGRTVVFQPTSDMTLLGLRVVYGAAPAR